MFVLALRNQTSPKPCETVPPAVPPTALGDSAGNETGVNSMHMLPNLVGKSGVGGMKIEILLVVVLY